MNKAAAKNDIQVVLQEYIGNRKAKKVAEAVYAVMQAEPSTHTMERSSLLMKMKLEHLCSQWSLW